MKTVSKETIIEFEEKKSKFIGYIKPVSSVNEAEKFIKSVRKKHPEATHNVPLYRVMENGQEYFKYNDDGEPTNTAGKPMAEILNILDVYNVAIVATRYFGGIKLGAGGLIRNYAKTAKLAINEAEITEYVEKSEFILDYDYESTSEVDSFLNINGEKYNIEISERNYSDRVTLKIKANSDIEEKLNEMSRVIVIRL
ncbi:IMPACT family protein [Pseudoleptotrichia goodfellowii]|uniref:Putative YigZ family protein n=1 Tax=Pseudoleptotrichia goodfellowii F0264 TaxID=596323 RepID=D0GKC1_9FUSO|nr:YigZ family protein [Pseudoleptotrichia goodfellowii]EEY35459.1 putative YigZ family protein [Pseudoleptotrichia goodfellowii F0264]MBF4805835.1 YigZ family protein [Pseudoleptotrichia goodfellowii]